jgi:hypothetical protein
LQLTSTLAPLVSNVTGALGKLACDFRKDATRNQDLNRILPTFATISTRADTPRSRRPRTRVHWRQHRFGFRCGLPGLGVGPKVLLQMKRRRSGRLCLLETSLMACLWA